MTKPIRFGFLKENGLTFSGSNSFNTVNEMNPELWIGLSMKGGGVVTKYLVLNSMIGGKNTG